MQTVLYALPLLTRLGKRRSDCWGAAGISMRKTAQKIVSQFPVFFVLAGLLGLFRIILGEGHNALDYIGCIALVGLLCAIIILLVNGIGLAKQQLVKMYYRRGARK